MVLPKVICASGTWRRAVLSLVGMPCSGRKVFLLLLCDPAVVCGALLIQGLAELFWKMCLKFTCLPEVFALFPFSASPLPGRKCISGCPSSKNVSPTSSPRTLGRGKGRLRLPQLCKNKLSSSKENLDANREGSTDPDPKITPDQGDCFSRRHTLGGSQGELCTTQDEGTMASGYLCKQNCHSSGSLISQLEARNGDEEMMDDQRGDICVNPIYNLYAISVGVSTQIVPGGNDGSPRPFPPLQKLGFCSLVKGSPPLVGNSLQEEWNTHTNTGQESFGI